MIKKWFNKNVIKAIIIGIVIIAISALMMIVSNSSKSTKIAKSNLSNTISFNGYISDNLGKYIGMSWNTWQNSRDIYCLQHGYTFPSTVRVKEKVTVSNAKITKNSGSKTTTETDEWKIQYNIAMLHLMAEAHNKQGSTISYLSNSNAYSQSYPKNTDTYQRAMWAVMRYYWEKSNKAVGHSNNEFRWTHTYTGTDGKEYYRGYAQVARRAIHFARFAYNASKTSPQNTTNMDKLTYTKKGNNTIVGPYTVTFPTTNDGSTLATWNLKFGSITGRTNNNNIEFCDAKGNEIDVKNIKSGTKFYILVKGNAINQAQNVSLKFDGYNIQGNYYILETGSYLQNLSFYSDGKVTTKERTLTLKVPPVNTVNKFNKATFNIEWEKTDESYNTINETSVFSYSINGDVFKKYDSSLGIFKLQNINIDIDTYNSLESEGEYKKYEIIVKEEEAPEGYQLSSGEVKAILYLKAEESGPVSSNNGATQTNTTNIMIKKCIIENNTSSKIRFNSDEISAGNNKQITGINKSNYTLNTIKIPNKEIIRPSYKLTLNKLNENNALIDDAIFKITVSDSQDLSVAASNSYQVVVSSESPIITSNALNGGFISGDGEGKLIVSNVNNIITVSSTDKGTMTLDLNNIYYQGDFYITIEEKNAPSVEYNKISKSIILKLIIDEGEVKSIETVQNPDSSLVNIQNNAQNSNITVKNTKEITPVGNASFRIHKLGNNSTVLENVKFGVYDTNGNYLDNIKTRIYALGDVNKNGKLDESDKQIIDEFLAENIDNIDVDLADVDRDGRISTYDSTRLLAYIRNSTSVGYTRYVNEASDVFKVEYEAALNAQEGTQLPIQTYVIKELETADGYVKLQDDEQIVISMQGIVKGSKVVTKYIKIENQTKQEIQYTLDGEHYDVINSNSSKFVDNNNGINTTNFIININNIKSQEGSYSFNIKKVDSSDYTKVISGAGFALYNEEQWKPGVSIDASMSTAVTDSNGIAQFNITGLTKEGTFSYYIKEISAADGYKILSDNNYIELEITVGYNDDTNTFEVTKAVVYNMLQQFENNGSRYIIVNSEQVNPFIYDGSEDTAIEESIIAEKYMASKAEINENNTLEITIPNDKVTQEGEYTVNIEKISATTKNTTPGAVFELTSDSDNVSRDEYTSVIQSIFNNGTGQITKSITNEDYQKGQITYHLKEITAPNGYQKLDGQVDIEVTFGENETSYDATITVTNNTNGMISVNGDTLGVYESQEVLNPEITIKVENESKIDLALKKFISGVIDNNNNYTATSGREPIYDTASLATTTEATYTYDKTKPVEVAKGYHVIYTIRIYNEGQSDGYATLIKDYLPNGVKLVENSQLNNRYGWTIGQDENNKQYISTRHLENEKLGKYEGGIILAYRDVQVELEVTEPDMYIGTLTNVAEIAEMKDANGNVITQDVDSSTKGTIINRSGETITDYNPKEDDIDFEWIKLKNPTFGGKVWLDVPENNTKDEGNNLIDSHESYDVIKYNGGVTAVLYKNGSNEPFRTTPVRDDGTYEFEDVPKSDNDLTYNSYVIKFVYNGMDYTNVLYKVGNDSKINSKARETTEDRTAFNNKFATINNQSAINYTSTSDEQNKKIVTKYNFADNMKITAATETIALNINTNTEELKYYNLGLKQRPTFDMALYKDVAFAAVTVNGQTETITYDKLASYNPELGAFEPFAYSVRTSDINLDVRKDDRDPVAGLDINITYAIKLLNQSSTYGYVSKLVDYYDSNYTFVSAEVRNNNRDIVNVGLNVTPNENSLIANKYHYMNVTIDKNADSILDNNESLYVYVTLKFKNPVNALQNLGSGESLRTMNFAEITEYSTFTQDSPSSSTPGLIDINSAPGNFDIVSYTDNAYMENDNGCAPAFTYVDNGSYRTLTGNVFEDADNRLNIKDIKVELIEIDGNGNPIMEGENYRALTYKVTTTDENGNYTFDHFLPGNYIVRFSYGNNYETVLTIANGGSNEHSYNGQDYSSTDYVAGNYTDAYWYTRVTDKSDATDNTDRRNEVNAYSKVLTNNIAEVLNSWKVNSIDESKVQELIAKTNMFADTAKMTMSVEYGAQEILSNNIQVYNVSGIDFGLKKRPTSEIELTKNVSKLTLKSSSGETLVEAAPQRNGNSVQWMVNSFVKIEQEDSVLNGANLEIEYTLTAKGTGEVPTKASMIVDYIDNNLRFEESANPDWQVIQVSELQNMEDETKSLVNNSIDLSNRQTIVVTTDNNPLETKLANGETANTKIVLTKTLTTSNSVDDDLSYNNIAEILITENDEGRITQESIPGNIDPNELPEKTEPGDAVAELVSITNPTGQTRIYYVLGLAIAVILVVGIVSIKKFVLDKRS